jgi:hypothetical protein
MRGRERRYGHARVRAEGGKREEEVEVKAVMWRGRVRERRKEREWARSEGERGGVEAVMEGPAEEERTESSWMRVDQVAWRTSSMERSESDLRGAAEAEKRRARLGGEWEDFIDLREPR